MSADNWACCPRCFSRALALFREEAQRVASSYGVVPVDEFDRARAALKEPNPDSDEFATFREDYEFAGARTGTLEIRYSGSCTVCSLRHGFHDTQTFWSEDGTHGS